METEQKYDVDQDFVLPDLAGTGAAVTVSKPDTLQLAATYFDTADLRLASARITLRRRTGGPDEGWHVKLPVSTDTRRELHFPLGPATGRVPSRIAELAATWTHGEPLRPIARLDTRRTVRRLADEAGNVLAEVADDQVTGSRPAPADGAPGLEPGPPDAAGTSAAPGDPAAPRWQEVASWREVEVELVSGTRDLLEAAGQRLRAAGAKRSASASKLSRLLATPEPPAHPDR
jgi:inorganic triphosphatase YgiF